MLLIHVCEGMPATLTGGGGLTYNWTGDTISNLQSITTHPIQKIPALHGMKQPKTLNRKPLIIPRESALL